MKSFMIILALGLVWLVPGDSFSRGPAGGGGGARPSGGGGGGASPSFSGAQPHQGSSQPHQGSSQQGGHPGFVPGNQSEKPGSGSSQNPNEPKNTNNANSGNQANVNRNGNYNSGNQANVNRNGNYNSGNQANVNRNGNYNSGNQANVNRNGNYNSGNQANVNRNGNYNSGNQANVNRNGNYNSGNQTNNSNNQVNVNRPYGSGAYQGNWSGWHSGSWNNWNYRPTAWLGAGVAGGWMLGAGETYVYSNPFYVAVPSDPGPDYSQPIAVPPPPPPQPASAPDAEPPPPPEPPSVPDKVTREVNDARAAFKQEHYPRAQDLVEKAIAGLPGDATLHEFRGLTLFAQEKYKDAASTIYALLSAGPGWNWDTMKSFYRDVSTYTRQLRALESFVKANPKSSDGHFLLAYHYLVLNQTPAAIKELQQVVQLVPNDKLCPQLIRAFAPPDGDRPTPQVP